MTNLENRRISIKDNQIDGLRCKARCYDYLHSTRSIPRNWTEISKDDESDFDCDFVHTECRDVDGEIVDSFVHMQIVETGKSTVPKVSSPPNATMPDVYLFVLDSVASTQARRSLPRTLSFLETQMGGMHMHHLNKVGENSRPNGFAMLLGKRIKYLRREAMGGVDLEPVHNMTHVCKSYHDNDFVIFKEFEKIGYRTLFSDDYGAGSVFTYPDCFGFEKQEANHMYSTLTFIGRTNEQLRKFMGRGNCFERYSMQLKFIENFIHSYPGKNKFVTNWVSEIGHDDPNLLFHSDATYEQFFRSNQEKLENAFIFFAADHGPRYGSLVYTTLGKRELKNPLLHITVPKWLRSNEQLMSNLRENSLKLLTQYDVFATLLDILKYSPQSNYTDFSFIPMDESKINNGTSILRPLGPFSHRNCRNVPVDASYCLCEYRKEKIEDEEVGHRMAQFVIDEINEIFVEFNVTKLCTPLTLEKVEKGF
ncbi:unnamed protein product, partial [Mesorhabditis belari]|uniref:Uncharacterized protein n=1 Tax=Mesorhabditis belari TaxID=2138241 RepID=A0AAF3EGA4_9BILA